MALWRLAFLLVLSHAKFCGVSKPLFKDSTVKVEPIDTNWLQKGLSLLAFSCLRERIEVQCSAG